MNYKPLDHKLSTRFGSLPTEAIDEAIEQHRAQGHAIAVSDNDGNIIEIQLEDITPLVQKLKQRQQQTDVV